MTTPLITIPLSEYERIKEENETLNKAFYEKAIVLGHSSYFTGGPGGYFKHGFSVTNADEINQAILKDNEELKRQLAECHEKISDLVFRGKKSFWR